MVQQIPENERENNEIKGVTERIRITHKRDRDQKGKYYHDQTEKTEYPYAETEPLMHSATKIGTIDKNFPCFTIKTKASQRQRERAIIDQYNKKKDGVVILPKGSSNIIEKDNLCEQIFEKDIDSSINDSILENPYLFNFSETAENDLIEESHVTIQNRSIKIEIDNADDSKKKQTNEKNEEKEASNSLLTKSASSSCSSPFESQSNDKYIEDDDCNFSSKNLCSKRNSVSSSIEDHNYEKSLSKELIEYSQQLGCNLGAELLEEYYSNLEEVIESTEVEKVKKMGIGLRDDSYALYSRLENKIEEEMQSKRARALHNIRSLSNLSNLSLKAEQEFETIRRTNGLVDEDKKKELKKFNDALLEGSWRHIKMYTSQIKEEQQRQLQDITHNCREIIKNKSRDIANQIETDTVSTMEDIVKPKLLAARLAKISEFKKKAKQARTMRKEDMEESLKTLENVVQEETIQDMEKELTNLSYVGEAKLRSEQMNMIEYMEYQTEATMKLQKEANSHILEKFLTSSILQADHQYENDKELFNNSWRDFLVLPFNGSRNQKQRQSNCDKEPKDYSFLTSEELDTHLEKITQAVGALHFDSKKLKENLQQEQNLRKLFEQPSE